MYKDLWRQRPLLTLPQIIVLLLIGAALFIAVDLNRRAQAGQLVGVVSERDLLRASLSHLGESPSEERRAFLGVVEIARIMSAPAITIGSESMASKLPLETRVLAETGLGAHRLGRRPPLRAVPGRQLAPLQDGEGKAASAPGIDPVKHTVVLPADQQADLALVFEGATGGAVGLDLPGAAALRPLPAQVERGAVIFIDGVHISEGVDGEGVESASSTGPLAS